MLFQCYQCHRFSFHPSCPTCGPQAQEHHVPLNPEFYPEFQYRSQGFFKDLLFKRKIEKELQSKLDAVLKKYADLENPYFINFFHVAGNRSVASPSTGEYSSLALFHEVLVRKGFAELKEMPQLTHKLVRSTALRFLYSDFVRRTEQHVSSTLSGTLQSWIEERGPVYRTHLPLMLYFLWEKGVHTDEIQFTKEALPLVANGELERIHELCEWLYFDIRVRRFQITLEGFDPKRFLTVYAIDAMSGYEFEDFLANLFRVIGYDVQMTKRSGDQGADLFVEQFGRKTVIQAKNYSENVGNAAVQQALAAKAFYACDRAMVVTNSFFTASARELAEAAGVDLVDRKALAEYLDQYNMAIMEAATSETVDAWEKGDQSGP